MSLLSAASLPKAAPSSSPAPRSSGVPSSSIAQPQPQPVSGSGPVSGSAPLYSTSNVVYGQVLGGPAPTPSVPQQTFSGYPAVYPQQPAPYPSLHTPPPSASPASSSASRYTPEQKQRMTGPLAQPLTQKAPAVDPKVRSSWLIMLSRSQLWWYPSASLPLISSLTNLIIFSRAQCS